jgi:hypothetical protein
MGARRGRGRAPKRVREQRAENAVQAQLRREAEAHFRWAREEVLRREAEPQDNGAYDEAEVDDDQPVVPEPEPASVFVPEPEPEPEPEPPEPVVAAAAPEPDPEPELAPEPEPEPHPAPATSMALAPAIEQEWQQLVVSRRELSAEWARLGAARERIELAYERLDGLREQLDADRRQLERQREQLLAERFRVVGEPRQSEPRRVADNRPWGDARSHLVEAMVMVRAAMARRARHPFARRDRAEQEAARQARGELPPGNA